jgi:outer membrane protein assembly factor BamA
VSLFASASASGTARAAGTPPPPAWLDGRAPVSDADGKIEGGFADALPLVAYDPNTGLGGGIGAHYTMTGTQDDPLFRYTPYRHRLYAQAYATTGGYQQHLLSYDGYYVDDSPYRLRAALMFERNTNANYFGSGAASLAALSFQGRSYATYDEAARAAGARYFHYGLERPQAQLTLDRSFFGGRVRALYGVNVQRNAITSYDSAAAFEPTTKLGADCAAGIVTGCHGGWNNTLRAGVAFDTRDFDPDPTSGVFVDSTGQWSARGFGSAEDYVRLTTAARGYASPFRDVVFAGRVLYSVQSANAPFYTMNTLAMAGGTDDATDQTGLGGERTLRGFRQDRFVGRVAAAANAEVRWTFARFPIRDQAFSLQVAPLVDAGRVFDRVGFSLEDWKVAAGAGLRIGWNRSTMIIVDFAASREDTGLFVDFGTSF